MLDAARRGQTIVGSTIYSTTLPCHECTRHIIGVGVHRVVYIEPYAKSLAPQLHDDAIVIDVNEPPPNKVRFEPFVGVSPRRYLSLFMFASRRDGAGDRLAPEPGAQPKSLKEPIEMEPEEPELAPCPACGHGNPPGARFCSDCGRKLDDGASEAQDGAKHESAKPPETVLSDPAIRFQELLKGTLFRQLLTDKQVRLK